MTMNHARVTHARASRQVHPAITSIGFVTCNRPATLDRAMRSYLANARQYGRRPRIVVCDDSREPVMSELTRAHVKLLAREYGVAAVYAGLDEKRRLAAALALESGVDRSIIDFALFDVTGCHSTFGANRNALQLLTAGELVLNADDDTICKPAVAPETGGLTRFVGEHDPTEYWFYPDLDQAFAAGRYADLDVLGEHERLLGRSLASIVARDPARACLRGVCRHMKHAMSSARGSVVLTPAGVLGDSGMHSGAHLLLSRSPTRERLLSSEATYRSALSSRAILRAVRGEAVAHPTMLAGTIYGVDNRTLRLPFLPVLRNEDGFYSSLLRQCFEDAYFGYPGHALVHAPAEARAFAPGAYIEALGQSRFTMVLLALISSLPRGASPHGELRREALGRALVEVASRSESDFRTTMKDAVFSYGGGYAAWLEKLAQSLGEGPAFWSDDVQMQLATYREATVSPTYWLAEDLRAGRSDEEVARLTQQIVRQYGELLIAWDAIALAARFAAMRADLVGAR